MRALIVYAHPEPTSFTAALKDTAASALSAAGHSVEVSDLYGEGFNPVAGRHDFTSVADGDRFHYQTEQLHASDTNCFASDLRREQERLSQADLLIFVFPLWWGGLPAILKGWFDRVCAYGVAYADGRRFDKGYFVGRRAMLGVTTGGTIERFSADGAYGEFGDVLYPVRRCILEYLGVDVMEPFVAYAAPRVDPATRAEYLRRWKASLLTTVNDTVWQERLASLTDIALGNRSGPVKNDWALQR
jgi:NAD(P)H dehydrogenase (quinone)